MICHSIEVIRPEKYHEDYATESGFTYGVYDPGFQATVGIFAGRNILVEIFGGGKTDKAKTTYLEKKEKKLEFNKRYDTFLAIDFLDCYSDKKLKSILEPYIGNPVRSEYHHFIPSAPATMLSVVDDTLARCQEICDCIPDGILPSIEWFTKMGNFKNREIAEWEPRVWNGLCRAISAIGWQEVRKNVIRSDEQIAFERRPILREMKTMLNEYGLMPSQILGKKHLYSHRDLMNRADRTLRAAKRMFNGGEDEAVLILAQSKLRVVI